MKRWSPVRRALLTVSAALLALVTSTTTAFAAPYHQVNGPEEYASAGQEKTVSAQCPEGEVPTGGGGYSTTVYFAVSRSFAIGSTWYWSGRNTHSTDSLKVSAFAICTRP
ncbi:hypothetical protein A8W25_30485 [Streptomyces sp. ERV7]|uniref:hypothetical protein n=1 Tax=Streptomyces sp. ERV7 TaxID=1322334 RepID=UPI0007F456D8|nr:hypothetical protein [Streptomyces sp. ERV7]OAR21973.1 hypothetical protein A8W25_30485 [Streptomyces sp. ERV7]